MGRHDALLMGAGGYARRLLNMWWWASREFTACSGLASKYSVKKYSAASVKTMIQ